jgi:hypothetical protein
LGLSGVVEDHLPSEANVFWEILFGRCEFEAIEHALKRLQVLLKIIFLGGAVAEVIKGVALDEPVEDQFEEIPVDIGV